MGKNVIFLDIDSCLNGSSYGETCYDSGRPEFIEQDLPLCEDSVENLRILLASIENPAVVWSSSWRNCDDATWNGWRNPRIWLEAQDWFKPALIGKTPMKMSSVRHEEIGFWLYWNEYNRFFDKGEWIDVSNFIIIDDIDYGMGRYGKHLFRCEYDKGFTADMATDAIKFLSEPCYIGTDWFKPDEYDIKRKEAGIW